jgi:hypothetical protein
VRALSPLPLPGTPHDSNARPHQSSASRTGVRCQHRHSAIVSRCQSQTLSGQSTPQAAATSGAIGQFYVPRPPQTSRSRFTGALPRTGIAASPRPPAGLNPHRPRPSIRGFVQPGFCEIPPSCSAPSTRHHRREADGGKRHVRSPRDWREDQRDDNASD